MHEPNFEIDPDLLREQCLSHKLIQQVHVYQRIGSTNAALQRLAKEGAPAGTLVIADQQTAGRGRLGRNWASPPGVGIWMSLLLRPNPRHSASWGVLPLVLSEIVAAELNRICPGFQVKWPNDVLIGQRKVCGILCEASWHGNVLHSVVAGIGVNVNQQEHDFAPQLRSQAVSLAQMSGQHADRMRLMLSILGECSRRLSGPHQGLQPLTLKNWQTLSCDLGKRVRMQTASGSVQGLFKGLTAGGEMILEQDNGKGVLHLPQGETTVIKEKA